MSVEALLGTDRVFAADLQELRPHPGQAASASQPAPPPRRFGDHGQPPHARLQPGAGRLLAALRAAGRRCRARHPRARPPGRRRASWPPSIDNPVLTADGRVGVQRQLPRRPGRLRAATSSPSRPPTSASMSERRTDRFLDVHRNGGLPPFLADDPGVDSGHMIAQYTQAGIVSELKRLAAPASVDSIPSSAMQEDHVSMGWSAGRKLLRAVDGLTRVLAIEMVTAARAIDLRAPLTPSPPPAPSATSCASRCPGPARTATSPPTSRPRSTRCARRDGPRGRGGRRPPRLSRR